MLPLIFSYLKKTLSALLICGLVLPSLSPASSSITPAHPIEHKHFFDIPLGSQPVGAGFLHTTRQSALVWPIFQDLAALTSITPEKNETIHHVYVPILEGAFQPLQVNGLSKEAQEAYSLSLDVLHLCKQESLNKTAIVDQVTTLLASNAETHLKRPLLRVASWSPPTALINEPWLLMGLFDVLATSRVVSCGPLILPTSYRLAILDQEYAGSLFVEIPKTPDSPVTVGSFFDGKSFLNDNPAAEGADAPPSTPKVKSIGSGEAIRLNSAMSITNQYSQKIQQALLLKLLLSTKIPLQELWDNVEPPLYAFVIHFLQGKVKELPADLLNIYQICRYDLMALRLFEEVIISFSEIFLRGPLAVITLLSYGAYGLAYESALYSSQKTYSAFSDMRKILMLVPLVRPYAYPLLNILPLPTLFLSPIEFYWGQIKTVNHELSLAQPYTGKFAYLFVQLFGAVYGPIFMASYFYTPAGFDQTMGLFNKLIPRVYLPAMTDSQFTTHFLTQRNEAMHTLQNLLSRIPLVGTPFLWVGNQFHKLMTKRGDDLYNTGVYITATLAPLLLVSYYLHQAARDHLQQMGAPTTLITTIGISLSTLVGALATNDWLSHRATSGNILGFLKQNRGITFAVLASTPLVLSYALEALPTMTAASQAAASLTTAALSVLTFMYTKKVKKMMLPGGISFQNTFINTFKGIFAFYLAKQELAPFLNYLMTTPPLDAAMGITVLMGTTHPILWLTHTLGMLPLSIHHITLAEKTIVTALALTHYGPAPQIASLVSASLTALAFYAIASIMTTALHFPHKALSEKNNIRWALTNTVSLLFPWAYKIAMISVTYHMLTPLYQHIQTTTQGNLNWPFLASAGLCVALTYVARGMGKINQKFSLLTTILPVFLSLLPYYFSENA